MISFKTTQLTVCLLTCFAIGASAFGSEKETAAKKLMQTMRVKEQIEPSFAAIRGMQSTMLDSQQLPAADRKMVDQIIAETQDEITESMSWKALEPIMLRAYGKVFSTGELEKLNSLFASEAGQVYIDKQAELQAALMVEISGIINELMPKIQAQTKDAIERHNKEQR